MEVLRIFGTSKLWYKASALPMPNKYAKKFESAMNKFLWIGKFEKLKLDEVKNSLLMGGLNLPCVVSKADSLFLSQTCRLLRDSTSKEYNHIKYWAGIYLKEWFPDMGRGPHAELLTPYFQHMKALLVAGFTLGDITVRNLKRVTAKELYTSFTSTFPPPKVIFKFDVDWDLVWKRLQYHVLDPSSREIHFLIIHNIVANKDRMHKFNMTASPACPSCGAVQDNVHLFCECVSVREAWFWLRQRLLSLLPPEAAATSNFEFLHFMFMKDLLDNEAVWLLGIYVKLVWDNVICKKKIIHQKIIENEVSLQYHANRRHLGHIAGIL